MSKRFWVCLSLVALAFATTLAGSAGAKEGEAVLGTTKVVPLHLSIDAKEFANMQPPQTGFGFGRPGGQPQKAPTPDTHRNTFGLELPWAKGELTYDGKKLETVGLRYKGNFTVMASRGLKKSLKIDIDRHKEGQKLDGLKTLNLNCEVTDPSRSREALAYAFFRAAGVPAPRTSFAELTLTVPGKYDREYVGVYTLVEQVNKQFLRRHFKDGSGLLMKPEGLQGGLQHLGNDWKPYADRYRPKGEPTDAQKKRLIDFTRLINGGSDAEFEKEVASYLDVDAFLRFIAANALLSNLDSFLAFGHNYFLYLRPSDNKFVFIPWDLDLSLAAWPAAGTPEQQVDLSVMHPHAGQNKLIDRLLALKEVNAKYRKVLEELTAGPFTTVKLLKELDAVEAALKGPMEKEKKAVAARKEAVMAGPFGGGVFGASLPPRMFFEKRPKLVAAQLAGESKGFVPPVFGFGPPGGGPGGPGGFPGGPGGFPGGPGGFGFPRVGEVMPGMFQDRLGLKADQKKQMAELQKEVEAKIKKILTEEQFSQWKRIQEGRGGPGRP